ncbi:hypothetical protein Y1Q_0010013 [Alligator mississippiensis]|uniref:SPRY-associated domain-containing protein n=1 Tax=Alligator mississippiensis TaxID=8496 RepID=A0A151MLH8_ALLMI|nr:hypothetical protein Y1Q_0010013 [Alligator mississippiensis]
MCTICQESRVHRAHPAAPVQEAAQQYKEQIQAHLEIQREERKRLEAQRVNERQKHQEYQEKAAAERQKVVAEFEQMHYFLEQQKHLLLAEMGELETGIEKSQEERDTKLTGEISCLDSLIRELEGKCQQTASDLLQDIRSTLSRCEKQQGQLLEAAQQYKEQIQARLEILREERKRLEALRANERQKHQEYQKKAAAERHKIVAEFEQLHWFLKEKEYLLLAKLEELEGEIERSQDKKATKLTGEIYDLDSLIRELEGKCQQGASDLLQMGKDIRITMSRCEKGQVQLPAEISPEIETRLENLSEKTLTVKETMRQFQEVLPSKLEKGREKPQGQPRKVTVTLDPDMAHPCLIVSADRRSVRSAETQYWLPNSPDRFHVNQCALGRVAVHEHDASVRECTALVREHAASVSPPPFGMAWSAGYSGP